MHFFNKLSTAAMMRLTILASLNLLLYRLLGGRDFVLHPFVFLNIVTLNLGLYAVMVYSGTLNKTLIGMMLGGLTATLAILKYTGMDASGFGDAGLYYWGPFGRVGLFLVESAINPALEALPAQIYASGPLKVPVDWLYWLGYGVSDALGLIAIAACGGAARILQASSRRRETPEAPLPLDDRAATPL